MLWGVWDAKARLAGRCSAGLLFSSAGSQPGCLAPHRMSVCLSGLELFLLCLGTHAERCLGSALCWRAGIRSCGAFPRHTQTPGVLGTPPSGTFAWSGDVLTCAQGVSSVHPDAPCAAGERFGFAQGPGAVHSISSPRTRTLLLPCAANGGSKPALLLFLPSNSHRGEADGVLLGCPPGVFKAMYSGSVRRGDPARSPWDLASQSAAAGGSPGCRGMKGSSCPMGARPGEAWGAVRGWEGPGAACCLLLFFFFSLHLCIFFPIPFSFSVSLPLCGLSAGATDRESLSNGLRAGAVFNHRVPESLALGLLGTRAYSENRQLQLRVKAQEPGWVFGIGRRAKKSWGRREGKGTGSGGGRKICPVVFFQGCVSEHRFPGAGRRSGRGGCRAVPPGSSLKSIGSPLFFGGRGRLVRGKEGGTCWKEHACGAAARWGQFPTRQERGPGGFTCWGT